MMKLEKHGNRLLCVLNKKKLIGVITDGDIRRALLKGLPGSASVQTIMNKKPVFLSTPENKYKIRTLMQKNKN